MVYDYDDDFRLPKIHIKFMNSRYIKRNQNPDVPVESLTFVFFGTPYSIMIEGIYNEHLQNNAHQKLASFLRYSVIFGTFWIRLA